MDFFWRSVKRVRETRRSRSTGPRRTLAAWVQQLERRELLTLTPIPASVNFIAGVSPSTPVRIGSFLDSNTAAIAGDFTATITWGDGNVSAGTVSAVSGSPGLFSVSGTNLYAKAGTYQIAITVQDNLGATANIKSTAAVTNPVLTPIGTTATFTAGILPVNPVFVGSFYDSDSTASAGSFTASISWGDGNVSSGTVTKSTSNPALFVASGANLYTTPGDYPVIIQVQDQTGHSTTINSTAVVNSNQVYRFTGGLAPIPGNGPSAASGYTNTNRPTFSGTAPPFATIELYARPNAYDVNNPLGIAIASASGQWTLATGPLADGIYSVTAVVTPASGYPVPMQPLANNGRVVIDTVAPTIVGFANSAAGQVTVYFRDDLSGMNFTSLSNASNYAFAGPRRSGFPPTSATVVAAGNLPTDVVGVVLAIPGNRRTWAMVQGLRITGTNPVGGAGGANLGITDNAGNPLQGYYGKLVSSASGRAGGNYHVKIRVPVFHGKRH